MKQDKRVILITGTPCVGKTTISRLLSARLGGLYVNLTELAEREQLVQRADAKRDTKIINEDKMRSALGQIIDATNNNTVIIDGHFASAVTPNNAATRVFVLRRNPIELKGLMVERGYSEQKLRENLASEVLDVCLVEALSTHRKEIICELDITGLSTEHVVEWILAVLKDERTCSVGNIDWLGILENQGILEEYLQI